MITFIEFRSQTDQIQLLFTSQRRRYGLESSGALFAKSLLPYCCSESILQSLLQKFTVKIKVSFPFYPKNFRKYCCVKVYLRNC